MSRHKLVSDYQLVEQFVTGDHSSFEELLRRYKDRVFTYIYLIVRNQELAEDIFQDTYVKVIKSLHAGKYQDNGKFLSWVLRIAHNLIIDHFRKEKQLNTISRDDYESDIFNSKSLAEKNVEDIIVKDQISKDVRNLIDELPDDQKQVIILRHYLNFSFKEIADYTDVSINTALGRMRYALLNLRKLVEERNLMLIER